MKVVTGLFTPENVGPALRRLRENGFSAEDLSVLSSSSEMPDYLDGEPEEAAAAGATVGAVAGGSIGALGPLIASSIPGFESMFSAGLLTTTLGGVVGGFLGSLYNVRAKEQPGLDIHEELEAGKFLLLAKTDGVEAETAVSLMEENNGQHVEIHTISDEVEQHTD
jgi:hypothetical protein